MFLRCKNNKTFERCFLILHFFCTFVLLFKGECREIPGMAIYSVIPSFSFLNFNSKKNNLSHFSSESEQKSKNVLSRNVKNEIERSKSFFTSYQNYRLKEGLKLLFVLNLSCKNLKKAQKSSKSFFALKVSEADSSSSACPFLSSSFPSASLLSSSFPSASLLSSSLLPSAFSSFPQSVCDSTGRFCWTSNATLHQEIDCIFNKICARDSSQLEFLQAIKEVLYSLEPLFRKDRKYLAIFETIAEPERTISFRVPWLDDSGRQHVNRGYRVQYSSTLGPYKGGLRFHPSVNLSIMKFLGFEQIFKNSLTGLSLGGGKGGADFNPKGKSDAEIQRFCQSFMISLSRHIGHNEDVPAGDIGVGGREIGYLYGQRKRMTSQFEGCLTGKNAKWGGSRLRTEATGYGAVYFADEVSKHHKLSLEGKRCLVSGSGNVALHCAQKLIEFGAKVLTLSDSGGFVFEENGFTSEKLQLLSFIKNEKKGRISQYVQEAQSGLYFKNCLPWNIECDFAFPCATQNEILIDDARNLINNKCKMIVEGANMPCNIDSIELFKKNNVIFCPAKAANAGGVAVSGLEMSQNSMRLYWNEKEVDEKLKKIMKNIFLTCIDFAEQYNSENDLLVGANIAAFLKVADSLVEQGCV